jgi:hypothetical protein
MEYCSVDEKRHPDTKKDLSEHPHPLSWCPLKVSKVEPSLDHPTLFSLKRLPSEALIFYSGIFWSAPDNNFDGHFLEIDP